MALKRPIELSRQTAMLVNADAKYWWNVTFMLMVQHF